MDSAAGEGPDTEDGVTWTIYTDGSQCATRAGAATILVSPKGQQVQHATRLEFPTTNNAAEYEAQLLDLRKARVLGAHRIIVKSDSHQMAGHIDKSFQARDPEMATYP